MRNFILFTAFSAIAFSQCSSLVYNPVTHKLDCIGPSSGGGSTTVSGTANQITVTGSVGGPYTLSLPSAVTFPGSATITTNLAAGTVVSGLWNGTTLTPAYGGTGAFTTVAFSATPTYDASLGDYFRITLTGNVTSVTVSNPTASQTALFEECQDGTGSRTFAWPVGFHGAAAISPTASVCTRQPFTYDGSAWYSAGGAVTDDTPTVLTGPVRSAPATPVSGYMSLWFDTTDAQTKAIAASGVIMDMVSETSTANKTLLSGSSVKPTWTPYTIPATIAADQTFVATGTTAVAATSIGICTGAGKALTYDTATHTYGCNTISATGTVTSVSFTGGLISVANPTTVPAFTVAGTSGGIPYFSGSATWASSAAGVATALVAWGGTGAAPTSPLSMLVTNQNSATEQWTLYNSTATTGKTGYVLRAGAGQSSTCMLQSVRNDGTTQNFCFTDNGGVLFGGGTNGAVRVANSSNATKIQIGAANANNRGNSIEIDDDLGNVRLGASSDISLERAAAGQFDIANAASSCGTAANCRDLRLRSLIGGGSPPSVDATSCTGATIGAGATNTAGTITGLPTGTCTVVLTFIGTTATTGWSCGVSDQTTANLFRKTASSTTTITFAGTSVLNDVLSYGPCTAY